MYKDPWTRWEESVFPYDALEEAGITPDSSMRDVQESSFTLIERGAWNQQQRVAWDELRLTRRRLWVDFLQHSGSPEEVATQLEQWGQDLPDLSIYLAPDLDGPHQMADDFGRLEFVAVDPDIKIVMEFDS